MNDAGVTERPSAQGSGAGAAAELPVQEKGQQVERREEGPLAKLEGLDATAVLVETPASGPLVKAGFFDVPPTAMSPPGCVGPSFTGITGTQGPGR